MSGQAWRAAWLISVGLYLLLFRLHDIGHSFALLDEQVRDWSIAQLSLGHLPWAGPRSVNSGLDIGPVYYWFLWIARVVVGPFLGNMPHAGAWAISLLQTAADLVLLRALAPRLGSWPLAAFSVVLLGSSPLDAAMNGSIWNPPVALAFTKLALAAALVPGSPSSARVVGIALAGCAAVQCHASAVLPVTVIGVVTIVSLRSAEHRQRLALFAGTTAMLAVATALPYVLRAASGVSATGGGVSGSVSAVLADPAGHLRPAFSARAVTGGLETIFASPYSFPAFGWILLTAAAATVVAHRRTPDLAALAVGPVIVGIAAFALWQGDRVEAYWVLTVAPSAAVCLAAPCTMLSGRPRTWMVATLWAGLLLLQPARAHAAWTTYRLPQYGALVQGAQAVAEGHQAVRAVRAGFDVPDGMDPEFLYRLAGGRLTPTATSIAVIGRDGSIDLVPVD